MSVMDKIKKASTIKSANILADSIYFGEVDFVKTQVPGVNIALSGDVDGGFQSGITIWAGPSKHFKTSFTLLMIKAYLDKYSDGVCIFYDSEFGTPQAYFDTYGIDKSRVFHVPVTDIEQVKFDIMKQLDGLVRGDRVIFALDSAGNIASKKEVEDALDGKSVADMSRAKQMKSLFRMVTPHMKMKDLPFVVVNHTYNTIEMYSKPVVSGGTGVYYAADNIYIIGRQQEKDSEGVIGYNFIINVEKSRFVREKSKIPVQVIHGEGINRYSGLMDIALEIGACIKPSNGWYSKVNLETGEVEQKKYRLADTETEAFWGPVLSNEAFKQRIRDKFRVAGGSIITDDEIDAELESDID